jgi:sulfotransferase
MADIHFISGLPRSGSTLLAALLRQNPRFQAGMSGPLAGLFGALLGEMSARNEYSVFIDDAKRQRILHGLFDNFYAD